MPSDEIANENGPGAEWAKGSGKAQMHFPHPSGLYIADDMVSEQQKHPATRDVRRHERHNHDRHGEADRQQGKQAGRDIVDRHDPLSSRVCVLLQRQQRFPGAAQPPAGTGHPTGSPQHCPGSRVRFHRGEAADGGATVRGSSMTTRSASVHCNASASLRRAAVGRLVSFSQ